MPKEKGFIETKISANFSAYGTEYPFLNFWAAKTGNKITAAVCKFENTLFISADEYADFEEIRNFSDIIGYETIQAKSAVLEKMGFNNFNRFCSLKHNGNLTGVPLDLKAENLKEIYNIIYGKSEANIFKTDFAGWYADISHRIRHGTAIAVKFESTAAAVVSHITENSAVLSGIVTDVSKRGQGIGTKILNEVLCRLGNRMTFVITDKETEDFYLKSGFVITDEIGIYRR